LSDLLFILGRYANHGRGGDVLWVPGGGREQQSGGREEHGGGREEQDAADGAKASQATETF
jgi:cob(I)alamin adenosyltransferase